MFGRVTEAYEYRSEFCVHRGVPVTAVLLMLYSALAASALGAVRFEVTGSPTEVINTGQSEVVGSINLIVEGTGNSTGTATGGSTQIGLIFSDPPLQIDNTDTSGIRLFFSGGFAAAAPTIIEAQNRVIGGKCIGFMAISLSAGAMPSAGDFIRIEGIRARIAASPGIVPGTDLFVDLQSVNDPTATNFRPDRIRVAKSLRGLDVRVATPGLSYDVHITEGFARAFVDNDAANDGVNFNDRTDSAGYALGAPTNSTQIAVRMEGIPSGISDVVWPSASPVAPTGAALYLLKSTFSGGISSAVYSFEAVNQTGASDLTEESFTLSPAFVFGGGDCNTETLITSVTLAPADPSASTCAIPSADDLRPRFLEVFELSLISLSPTSAEVGTDSFLLTVHGTGFVPGSIVEWNGAERDTIYVSDTSLTAVIPASDLSRVATANITILNPQSLGSIRSNALQFSITPPPLSLYFPRLVAGAGDPGLETSESMGIALTNLSPRNATLKFTAFDTEGKKIAGDGISNPVTLSLAAGGQMPVVVEQVFGVGLREANPVGWMKVEGDVPEVVGMFLAFDDSLSRLDGADVSPSILQSILFTETQSRGHSRIHIANPNDEPAALNFSLVGPNGISISSDISRSLSPHGALFESIQELFPGVTLDDTDYIRVISSAAVVPLQYLFGSAGDTAVLNGQDAMGGFTTLYAPQYIAGGDDWKATLSLINLSTKAGSISLRFVRDDGTQLGSTQVIPVEARGKVRIDDPGFFVDAGDTMMQGYLAIRASDGVRLAGSIIFDSTRRDFVTALPLVSQLRNNLVFGQVASNEVFFTGLSLINPSDTETRGLIRVFDQSGTQVAARIEDIPAGGRKAGLLTEFFPDLSGRDIGGGYILVESNGSLAGFVVFGTRDLSVLTAVPAQPIPHRF